MYAATANGLVLELGAAARPSTKNSSNTRVSQVTSSQKRNFNGLAMRRGG